MISLKVTSNLEGIRGKVLKLPDKLDKSAVQLGRSWAQSVVKASKARAPSFTGTLKKNIKVEREILKTGIKSRKTWVIGIGGSASRYGPLVESGFRPHVIPFDYIDQHSSSPGTKGQYVDNANGFLTSMPDPKNTGFMLKAFNLSKTRLPGLVKKSLNNNLG